MVKKGGGEKDGKTIVSIHIFQGEVGKGKEFEATRGIVSAYSNRGKKGE